MSTPTHTLGLTTAYFNPNEYAIRRENFMRFYEGLGEERNRVVVVQLAFGEKPFDLPESIPSLRFRTNDVLWHKESLLNIGICELLARGYTSVAWIDADLIFENTDWYERTTKALEKHSLCQIFRIAHVSRGDGFRVTYDNKKHFGLYTGGGWAARADILKTVPLYDRMILGSFDRISYLSAVNRLPEERRKHDLAGHELGHLWKSLENWGSRWQRAMNGSVGYADNEITLLSHGTMHRRRYFLRHKLLEGYDPEKDVTTRPDGILAWSPDAAADLKERVANYFKTRDDDSVNSKSIMTYAANAFRVIISRVKMGLRSTIRR